MKLRRLAMSVVAGLAAASLALVAAAPASAAPEDLKILVFANPLVNDVAEEVTLEVADLAPLGATITLFDGGDGSAQAWAAALNGYDILLLPEMEIDGAVFFEADGGLLSVEAATTIKGWVEAGGWVFFHGSYPGNPNDYGYFLSYVTGKDYDSVFESTESIGWELQETVPGAPAILDYVDGTYGVDPTGWSADLLDGFLPIYNNISGDTAVASFSTSGVGGLFFIGYDWYPDDDVPDFELKIEAWATALRSLMSLQTPGGYPAVAPAPAPQLAATGSSAGDSALLVLGGASILMLLGAAILLRRRATA